jgi:hypothetical protein
MAAFGKEQFVGLEILLTFYPLNGKVHRKKEDKSWA